jgi:hypothetical protein
VRVVVGFEPAPEIGDAGEVVRSWWRGHHPNLRNERRLRDRNFNRGGSAIRRVSDAITARASTV